MFQCVFFIHFLGSRSNRPLSKANETEKEWFPAHYVLPCASLKDRLCCASMAAQVPSWPVPDTQLWTPILHGGSASGGEQWSSAWFWNLLYILWPDFGSDSRVCDKWNCVWLWIHSYNLWVPELLWMGMWCGRLGPAGCVGWSSPPSHMLETMFGRSTDRWVGDHDHTNCSLDTRICSSDPRINSWWLLSNGIEVQI